MTTLTNETLDAVMGDCILTEEEAANPDTVCVPGYGVIHHFALSPERLERHHEEIRDLLYELDPTYRVPTDEHPEYGGGWSFLNMCMTVTGEQWTGLQSQQEKLFALGCAAGWAKTFPRKYWPALPGGVPYLIVLNERVPFEERATVREMLDNVLATSYDEDTVKVATERCMNCGKGGEVTMPKEAYKKWAAGEYLQRAWPEGSAGEREQLINGTHPECFDKIFPPEEYD